MKITLVCASDLEIVPLRNQIISLAGVEIVITGIGILETCAILSRNIFAGDRPDLLLGFGVGGGFTQAGVDVLDICVADSEIIADFGLPDGDRIIPFSGPAINAPVNFASDQVTVAAVRKMFHARGVESHCGPFVSVNAVTATEARMRALWQQYRPVCENMEGVAVARVAEELSIPWIEIRCMSNLVGQRDRKAWRIAEAAARLAEVVAPVLRELMEKR